MLHLGFKSLAVNIGFRSYMNTIVVYDIDGC
jgi:hypothetical protein